MALAADVYNVSRVMMPFLYAILMVLVSRRCFTHSTEAGTVGVPIGVPTGMVDVVHFQSVKHTAYTLHMKPEPEPEPEPSVSR